MCEIWRGQNWIRPEKRLSIYLRDGCACVWCGSSEELTLDHLKTRSRGGTHHHTNLITSCRKCNSRRHTKAVSAFAKEVCGDQADEKLSYIRRLVRRVIPLEKAKLLIATHGSCAKAVVQFQPTKATC